jgi:hypothetical protein
MESKPTRSVFVVGCVRFQGEKTLTTETNIVLFRLIVQKLDRPVFTEQAFNILNLPACERV